MGFAADGVCHATVLEATTYACSLVSGTTSTGVVSCTGVGNLFANSGVLTLRFVQSTTSVVMNQTRTYQACDPPTVADGIAVGWLVAAAWACAFGVLAIRKALL